MEVLETEVRTSPSHIVEYCERKSHFSIQYIYADNPDIHSQTLRFLTNRLHPQALQTEQSPKYLSAYDVLSFFGIHPQSIPSTLTILPWHKSPFYHYI